ncbi:hypothetical protein CV014_26070 [Nostoc sp. CMAA1605]|nr:hypothetical protein [Nostoc sp. CMAA1605]
MTTENQAPSQDNNFSDFVVIVTFGFFILPIKKGVKGVGLDEVMMILLLLHSSLITGIIPTPMKSYSPTYMYQFP